MVLRLLIKISFFVPRVFSATPEEFGSPEKAIDEAWSKWRKEYNRVYGTQDEEISRRNAFVKNWHIVTRHNARNLTWTLGLNRYADWTTEEFKASKLSTPQNCTATQEPAYAILHFGEIPAEKDWTKEGAVSYVKDQGQCGSCWTFSTTGAIESADYLTNGVMYDISEQQLVDCAGAFNNHGCNGGLPSQAFEYIMTNGGIETEKEYPYQAKDRNCTFDAHKPTIVRLSEAVNITYRDENQLTQIVGTVSPVSIAYDCSEDFMLYKSGIYDPTQLSNEKKCGQNSDEVNHAVLAVGYGVEKGIPYFKVKNSWSPAWGEKGFFRIRRGVNACGLSNCASYPIVTPTTAEELTI